MQALSFNSANISFATAPVITCLSGGFWHKFVSFAFSQTPVFQTMGNFDAIALLARMSNRVARKSKWLNARNSVNLRVQLIHGPCYNRCPSSDHSDTDAQQCRTGRPAKDVYHCQARRLVSAQL